MEPATDAPDASSYQLVPPPEQQQPHVDQRALKLLGGLACGLLLVVGLMQRGELQVLSVDASTHPDAVLSLPGVRGPLAERHYAGTVLIHPETDSRLFYWFVEGRAVLEGADPADVPLIVWLNGGPGASSLTGLLIEGVGPLLLQESGELTPNPNSWHQLAHVLSWDQPVGSGFASTASEAGYVTSLAQAADDFLLGLRGFYAKHPEYSRSPLYLVGECARRHRTPPPAGPPRLPSSSRRRPPSAASSAEPARRVRGRSFAGKFIPHFGARIHAFNQVRLLFLPCSAVAVRCDALLCRAMRCDAMLNQRATAAEAVPLRGIGIGNGVFRPLAQYATLPELAKALGYSDAARDRAARGAIARGGAVLQA
jgi:carboxypeptidase C (cathepsin A)